MSVSFESKCPAVKVLLRSICLLNTSRCFWALCACVRKWLSPGFFNIWATFAFNSVIIKKDNQLQMHCFSPMCLKELKNRQLFQMSRLLCGRKKGDRVLHEGMEKVRLSHGKRDICREIVIIWCSFSQSANEKIHRLLIDWFYKGGVGWESGV